MHTFTPCRRDYAKSIHPQLCAILGYGYRMNPNEFQGQRANVKVKGSNNELDLAKAGLCFNVKTLCNYGNGVYCIFKVIGQTSRSHEKHL